MQISKQILLTVLDLAGFAVVCVVSRSVGNINVMLVIKVTRVLN